MMFTSLILVAGILGSLGVTVLDEEENLIPGASVELVQDDRVERRAVTNQDGYVEFPGLRPGTYLARASLDGSVNAEVRSEVPPGKSATLVITLLVDHSASDYLLFQSGDLPPNQAFERTRGVSSIRFAGQQFWRAAQLQIR